MSKILFFPGLTIQYLKFTSSTKLNTCYVDRRMLSTERFSILKARNRDFWSRAKESQSSFYRRRNVLKYRKPCCGGLTMNRSYLCLYVRKHVSPYCRSICYRSEHPLPKHERSSGRHQTVREKSLLTFTIFLKRRS